MKLERIQTSDGSRTYVNTTLDVSYRSINGTQTESTRVFIEGTNLRPSAQKHWRVLELGFGLKREITLGAKKHSQLANLDILILQSK